MRKDVLFTIFHLKLQNGHSLAPNRAERTISWLMGGSICWMEGYLKSQFCAESLRADKFKLLSLVHLQFEFDKFILINLDDLTFFKCLFKQICILHQLFFCWFTRWQSQPGWFVSFQFSFQKNTKDDGDDDEKGEDEHWHRSHEGQIWSRVSCCLP